ncbi:MAG TPA: LytTR family DNA-binding domain-containing protein [Puia sp.]|nr:LytTR family DNA-binding domain-containing protein [Puia sp.]
MIYKCVIVDDEPLAHSVLKNYIDKSENLNIEQQFYTAPDARIYLRETLPDILFLDIQMPEETGIQLLQSLPQKPITIFTTAFLHYSIEGFELGVVDYLVKPIRYERFCRAVRRATDFLELLQLRTRVENDGFEQGNILVKARNKRYSVERSSITHVQALKDYAIIYTDDSKHVVRSTMKEIHELLGSDNFVRVHKSFIVAKNKAPHYAHDRIEFGEFEIPVGRKYKKGILDLIIR